MNTILVREEMFRGIIRLLRLSDQAEGLPSLSNDSHLSELPRIHQTLLAEIAPVALSRCS